MLIRKTTEADVPAVMEIFDIARAFMRENGNATQWPVGSPSEEQVRADMASGSSYVCCSEEDGRVCATFALVGGDDPTYAVIEDGAWGADLPYAAIHRVASDGTERGVTAAAFAFAKEHYGYLRIDTHADNAPMQRAILADGFTYRGVIHIADGSPRVAFDWIRSE